jgi:hypothetical protein
METISNADLLFVFPANISVSITQTRVGGTAFHAFNIFLAPWLRHSKGCIGETASTPHICRCCSIQHHQMTLLPSSAAPQHHIAAVQHTISSVSDCPEAASDSRLAAVSCKVQARQRAGHWLEPPLSPGVSKLGSLVPPDWVVLKLGRILSLLFGGGHAALHCTSAEPFLQASSLLLLRVAFASFPLRLLTRHASKDKLELLRKVLLEEGCLNNDLVYPGLPRRLSARGPTVRGPSPFVTEKNLFSDFLNSYPPFPTIWDG